ncbi:hypothetical protein ACIQUU_21025 [Streptomyces sp. NPDC101116]|uniref:hypothetical protein n=1 Tax=Streptomyces sp. NPDC101116 TaxID=3366107 RepID=UPI00382DCE0A
MRFAVPSLTAGNGILLEHASNVIGNALIRQELFIAAGFRGHLVTALVIAEDDVPDVTAAHRGRPGRRRHPDREQPGGRGRRVGGGSVGREVRWVTA